MQDRRERIGEKKKCGEIGNTHRDSSRTHRIKRIRRGNVNIHHRLDRIPVGLYLPFFDAGRSTHVGFLFLSPLSAFFISLRVTWTRPRRSYLRSFLRPPTLIELSQTTPSPLHRYEPTILEMSPVSTNCVLHFPFPIL